MIAVVSIIGKPSMFIVEPACKTLCTYLLSVDDTFSNFNPVTSLGCMIIAKFDASCSAILIWLTDAAITSTSFALSTAFAKAPAAKVVA